MKIYPAIDIFNGKAVRLRQGRAEDVTVYGDPLDMARALGGRGAEWLHVVDLDGAFEGKPRIMSDCRNRAAFPRLKIQVGGGIRNMAALESLFDAGVQRAVLGTSAVTDSGFVDGGLRRWKDRIAIGIDARDGVARSRAGPRTRRSARSSSRGAWKIWGRSLSSIPTSQEMECLWTEP